MIRFFILCALASIAANGQQTDFGMISFKKADSIAAMLPKNSISNLPVLAHDLTHNLSTEVEKFRAIYKWVCLNVAIDYSAYSKTKKKRSNLSGSPRKYFNWNKRFLPLVFKKLVNEQKTACSGYAYLVKELATLANIECKTVNGFARTASTKLSIESTPNHAWNAVKLQNKWYLCDATWSSGKIVFDLDVPIFKKSYNDGFFLADPALFVMNHYPSDSKWTLLQNAPTFSDFLQYPILYREAFTKVIKPIYPIRIHQEVHTSQKITIEIATPTQLNSQNSKILIIKQGQRTELIPKVTVNNNMYTLVFELTKPGLFDIHVIVNESPILTYTARISKPKKEVL